MGDAGAGRRAVVIGSQCDALGDSGRLSFLPELATELYGVLIDPRLGACAPGLPNRPGGGLLLDPTHDEVLNALEEAFAQADSDSATLLVARLGHGMVQFGDFFFLSIDGTGRGDERRDADGEGDAVHGGAGRATRTWW